MKNRTIAIVTLLALASLAAAGCSSGKNAANNAANNAAQAAATAANAMSTAANNAGQTAGQAAGAAGTAAQNAMSNAASGASNAMTGAANAVGVKPNCGAVQPVWVNLKTKVYHEPGDPAYGNTKHGEYLCPSQATAQGFRPAGGATHSHHKSTM
jgi:hypothetical protein